MALILHATEQIAARTGDAVGSLLNAALRMHPPPVIFAILVGLTLAGSLLAGYGMAVSRTRSWLHILAFAATMSVAVYVILDFEFPRVGLVRLDSFDQVLVDLRDSMK